ncbi:MAG: T9SS type A sorting domain-containing protein [Flavobacterium sp.]|uniref:T9SS type A sorting domain-containing protein n=1 Tax=Flavobacterium sp. TaxID=239 RepID=UPI00122494D3|nr:T9SS type A sorting domain-containing protein [Flavobacterium sp.]RZJ63355.1 MAG: T9SS type A sorting domain-containing protein [Flavobacterium sp.]
MKKITLSMLAMLGMAGVSAQTYSTGTLSLSSFGGTSLAYTAKIDVASTVVTMTLIGPSTSWLGIGFDTNSMESGFDCVIFDGTNLSDRNFNGVGVIPPLDTAQNWTVVSNTVAGGVRTVVGTRALNTGDAGDYVFSAAAEPLTLVFARRVGTMAIGYHGSDSCGSTVANLTLGSDRFTPESVKIFPNPSKGSTSFELPSFVSSGEIKIYDAQGRLVKKQEITDIQTPVSTSGMPSGSYLAVVRTEYGNVTKTLLVE